MGEADWAAVRPNLKTVAEAADWWAILHGHVEQSAAEEDRAFLAAAATSLADPLNDRSHHVRRCSRIPAVNNQKSRFDAMWIVARIIHACTTLRRSNARVRSCRRNPWRRVRREM